MTKKEIADRLRHEASEMKMHGYPEAAESIEGFADELDPPNLPSGTVVWWRDIEGLTEWKIGIILKGTHIITTEGESAERVDLKSVQWEPARVLVDNEVAVKIPPVSEWPLDADVVDLRYSWPNDPSEYAGVSVTREEAERIESDAR